MAYSILLKSEQEAQSVLTQLRCYLQRSRFHVQDVCTVQYSRKGIEIQLRGIRLKQAKDYCGNHPGPCRALIKKKHGEFTYLEGADWVAFNNMVNDLLDKLGLVANVSSTTCIVRKGAKRRIVYGMFVFDDFGNVEWNKDENDSGYKDCRKTYPTTTLYPVGTPGIETWATNAIN